MKKLMFVAAVAAGMGAFALESANVVGYSNAAMENGFRLYTPMFQAVDCDTYDIQELIPENADSYQSGEITIQTLDALGNQGSVFLSWWGDGWYDTNDETPSIPLKKGEAIWISSPNESVTLRCCGEVFSGNVLSDTAAGFVAIGNPFPVPYNLQNLVPLTAEGDAAPYVSGEIYLQTLDTLGNQGSVFLSWWGDAWYDTADETPAINLQPGEAIWLSSPNATLKIKWQGFSL